jgi:ferritin-like metal-binding protein YciE
LSGRIECLERIPTDLLGKLARGKKCGAIEGIIDEVKEIMDEAPVAKNANFDK